MKLNSINISRIMRAIRVHQFGGPEVLKYETDVSIPSVGPTQVLIKIHCAGINPVETYIRAGTYARKPSLPFIPGGDGCGMVEAVGEQVQRFKIGDRVYTVLAEGGTYAEYTSVDESGVFPLPNNINFSGGAAIGVPYFTSYRAIFIKCQAKAGETILIHGASGGVGMAAVQLSKANGLTVYATAGSKEGLEVVKENGADFVFNHTEKGYTEKIMAASNNRGVDIIIEMLSNVNLQSDLEMIAEFGRIGVVGCRGTIEINPRLTMGKESSIIGVMLGKSSPTEMRDMGKAIFTGLQSGSFKPIVQKAYSLTEAAQAHIDIIQGISKKGKLIFAITDEGKQ